MFTIEAIDTQVPEATPSPEQLAVISHFDSVAGAMAEVIPQGYEIVSVFRGEDNDKLEIRASEIEKIQMDRGNFLIHLTSDIWENRGKVLRGGGALILALTAGLTIKKINSSHQS